MPGAGSANVIDRDDFLKGAVDAATIQIQDDDRDGPPEGPMQRPGTEAYGGKKGVAQAIAHPPKKKRPKKKVTKKKRTTVVADTPTVPPEYEDPTSPSLDDIERAKAILARAHQLDSPFVEDTTHTAVAEQFAIDDIDDEMVEAPAAPSPPKGAKEHVPDHLIEHKCGLPACLMVKKKLCGYLITHGITYAIRKDLEIEVEEQRLYGLYTAHAKAARVTMGHFIAALRLWQGGHPINPQEAVDLNSMKIKAGV